MPNVFLVHVSHEAPASFQRSKPQVQDMVWRFWRQFVSKMSVKYPTFKTAWGTTGDMAWGLGQFGKERPLLDPLALPSDKEDPTAMLHAPDFYDQVRLLLIIIIIILPLRLRLSVCLPVVFSLL